MRKLPNAMLFLCLLLIPSCASASAQFATASPAGPARYHFGGDSNGSEGWANPSFDDSGWPVAQQDRWPQPPFYSGGFIWVRIPVTVRSDTAEPLALRISSLSHFWNADEVLVSGVRLGSHGGTSPKPFVEGLLLDTVFDLPSGLTGSRAVASVALGISYPPFARTRGGHQADQRGGTDGAALARAAQQFGQEDDITVLTITFAPAEVQHA